MLAFNINSSML